MCPDPVDSSKQCGYKRRSFNAEFSVAKYEKYMPKGDSGDDISKLASTDFENGVNKTGTDLMLCEPFCSEKPFFRGSGDDQFYNTQVLGLELFMFRIFKKYLFSFHTQINSK